jgi:hypothetical protein
MHLDKPWLVRLLLIAALVGNALAVAAGASATTPSATAPTGSVTRAWRGDAVADARRTNLLRVLEAAGHELPADASGAEIEAAFVAHLGRLAGAPVTDAARLREAAAVLAEPASDDPMALRLLELRLVAAAGGWRKVETRATHAAPATPPPSPAELMVVAFVHGEQAARAALPAPTAEAGKPQVVEASLRRRLAQSGDLRDGEPTATGVKRFQARHGLVADGVVGARTLAALNTPVARQIHQLELNRARSRNDALRRRAPRYVEVNIPAYELRLVENGEVVLRSRVIVGDADTPTPIFDDQIRYVELNPYWYVPASIVPELVRQAGGDMSYFERNNYIVRGGPGTGEPLRLVQRPGPGNALGRMKFLFPNHHAVYLHDTSQPRLFGRAERSLSHGCVRVEKAMELAVALLARDGWDEARIRASLARGKTQRIELSEPVPVRLEYRTAFIDDAGVLQFRPDIYGHDAAGIGTFADTARPAVPRAVPRPEPEPRVAAADEAAAQP